LANTKLKDDDDDVEEIPQPIRGNKISKKNKKKNKNQQQDLEEDSAGMHNIVVKILFKVISLWIFHALPPNSNDDGNILRI